jgi:hypothetical protein
LCAGAVISSLSLTVFMSVYFSLLLHFTPLPCALLALSNLHLTLQNLLFAFCNTHCFTYHMKTAASCRLTFIRLVVTVLYKKFSFWILKLYFNNNSYCFIPMNKSHSKDYIMLVFIWLMYWKGSEVEQGPFKCIK